MRPAELEHALRRGALGALDQTHLHRALLETPSGEHHSRDSIREYAAAELARLPDAAVTTIADLDAMSASRVEAIPDGAGQPLVFSVHRWIEREAAWIARETVITDLPLKAEAQLPQLALGELRAGRGQFAPGPHALLAHEPPPAARAAADLWHRFWNARAFDLADTLAPDPADSAHLRRFALRWLTALPDALLLFDRAVAEGDTAALLWRLHGHHHGPLSGHAPTGRRIRLWGSVVFRMDGAQVTGMHMVADEAAALGPLRLPML